MTFFIAITTITLIIAASIFAYSFISEAREDAKFQAELDRSFGITRDKNTDKIPATELANLVGTVIGSLSVLGWLVFFLC